MNARNGMLQTQRLSMTGDDDGRVEDGRVDDGSARGADDIGVERFQGHGIIRRGDERVAETTTTSSLRPPSCAALASRTSV